MTRWWSAYHKIMQRIGRALPRGADASGGGIGGWDTREFDLPLEVGESHYLRCGGCG